MTGTKLPVVGAVSIAVFSHLVLPIIGLVIIGFVWFSLDPTSKQLGFIWMAIGIVYMIALKLFKKDSSLNVE